MAGPSYPGQRAAVVSSVTGVPGLSRTTQRACLQQQVSTGAHLGTAVSVPFIPAGLYSPPEAHFPVISQEEEGLLPWNSPQGRFLCHCSVTRRKWSNGPRNRCMRLSGNCWKPSSPSCGTIEKAHLEGQRDQGWSPGSAMEVMLCGVWDKCPHRASVSHL